MNAIKLLPKSVAEKIAAGEVVERPASVVKELVENSIDAGAKRITVEIERGGVSLIRVTDDGCGIAAEDVPTAFLRHATSKIKVENDLDSIATLGFRGEALAAISAVSKVQLITSDGNGIGTVFSIEGGENGQLDEIGCAKGTIISVSELFYNVPARMKFLKKDVSEGNAVAAVIDRLALSHPDIAFVFIRDGKRTLVTSGDGKLLNVIYNVLGRDFASSLIEVNYELSGIKVSGYICKPIACRPNRNYQFMFLNGRFVKSGTAAAALDNAYKNSAMIGKYPAALLNVYVPFDSVDVNVHPAKTEVRFSDEKKIFDSIYFACKSALAAADTRPEIVPQRPYVKANKAAINEYKQLLIGTAAESDKLFEKNVPHPASENKVQSNVDFNDSGLFIADVKEYLNATVEPSKAQPQTPPATIFEKPATHKETEEDKPQVRFIGEAFRTYIIAEMNDSIYLIDKHAAHERILFEQLKNRKAGSQLLISPVSVTLTKNEYETIVSNLPVLLDAGFETEDFGNGVVVVRTVPANLSGEDVGDMMSDIADSLSSKGKVELERLEEIYHRVACRSAIKAGNTSSALELSRLAERVLTNNDILYCPHGRPVAFEISRRNLEKHFGRIQ